jgi:hypothetical protein
MSRVSLPGATGMPGYRRSASVCSGRAGSIPAASIALRAARADARHVVLDLGGTTFIDMSGVRILLAAAEHAHAAAGTFEIVHPTAPVTRMLTLTGADRALGRPTVGSPQRRERATARGPSMAYP